MQRQPVPQSGESTGMQVARIMSSPIGRIGRILLGIVLIAIGMTVVDAPWSYILEALGVVPIVTAIWNVSILARLVGGPFRASDR